MTVDEYLQGPSDAFDTWAEKLPGDTLVAVTACDDGDLLVSVDHYVFGEQVVFATTKPAREPILSKGAVAEWAALNGIPCVTCPSGGGFALMPETDQQRLAEKLRWR